jgi:hypothetical protein
VYVVEQFPEDNVQTDWLKEPVLLLVLQVTLPVGPDPNTVVMQVTGEPTGTGLGEQTTEVDDETPKLARMLLLLVTTTVMFGEVALVPSIKVIPLVTAQPKTYPELGVAVSVKSSSRAK